MRSIQVATAAAMLMAASTATAAVRLINPLSDPASGVYTSVMSGGTGAGVYGVELRGGNSTPQLNGTFEIGVGKATSQSNFTQGQFNWGCVAAGPAGCGTVFKFSLTWTPSALKITVGGTTVTSPGGANLAVLTGNTLRVSAKRDASFSIASVDGTAFAVSGTGTAGNDVYFYSNNGFGGDGFTATGTVRIKGGGNSANGISFSHGTFVPAAEVPEPATWALMIAGFGLVGAALRRRSYLAAL